MASEAEIREAFNAFDADGSGFISSSEIQNALGKMGVTLSAEEANKLISVFDANKSGKMEFGEFLQLVKEAEKGKA